MNKKKHFYRIAEKALERKLHTSGCVIVTGPKACGKTTLSRAIAKSETLLKSNQAIALAKADPLSTLSGSSPHLIDEWQKVPEIFNLIRNDLDEEYEFGKYILTGSTTPLDPSKIQHNGAGRVSFLNLKTLSLFESGESNGLVSLSALFQNPNRSVPTIYPEGNPISLKDIAYLRCRGGWPISCKAEKEYAIDATKNYYDVLFTAEGESDEFSEFFQNKDVDLLKSVLKEVARNISTEAKKTTMVKDILSSGERKSLDEDTLSSYLNILKNIFLIYDRPAKNRNLRSSVSVRVSPTYHFYDTSIALASLEIQPGDLLNDLNSFGLFFEDFAIHDLSIYSQSIQGVRKHYLDSNGQEVDAIIEIPNGDYAAIEIKIYSPDNIKAGISSLSRFQSKRISSGNKPPLFSAIVTSHGPCYKTKEGILIIPINYLKD